MSDVFPIGRFIISILLLCWFAFMSAESYGTPDVYMVYTRALVIGCFLPVPAIIAYMRHLIKRNKIAWLACLWIIPFSWFIALCMAIFGKTNYDNSTDSMQNHTVATSEINSIPKVYNQQPQNTIDQAFYNITHGMAQTAITIRDSSIVRSMLRLILFIAVVLALGIASALLNSHQQIKSRNSSAAPVHNFIKNNKYNNTINVRGYYKLSHPSANTTKSTKSEEQIWFEQAAASMK